ncbi:hypothetical protein [Huintestinicola sp.]
MAIVLLILIGLALLAGVIFLAYKFGDFVIEMFTQLIGMPKEHVILLLVGMVLSVLGIKMIKHIKRFD